MSQSNVTSIAQAAAFRQAIASFGDAGWLVAKSTFPQGALGGPVIYLCDVETGNLNLVALVKDALPRLAAERVRVNLEFNAICDALGTLMGHIAHGQRALSRDTRKELTVAAGLYISGTQAYELNKGRMELAQFVVLRYPDAEFGGHLLRPVPLIRSTPLAPPDIERVADQVLQIDRANHPERFPRAEVLQFRVKPPRSSTQAED